MRRGYHLVCPDLGAAGQRLSLDDQTRLHSYLIGRIGEVTTVPVGLGFEVIPLRWHHHGEAYPAIGMFAEPGPPAAGDLTVLSLQIEDGLSDLVQRIGLEPLLQLSSGETLRWEDVLHVHDVPSTQETSEPVPPDGASSKQGD